jgi:hypothetical protein
MGFLSSWVNMAMNRAASGPKQSLEMPMLSPVPLVFFLSIFVSVSWLS